MLLQIPIFLLFARSCKQDQAASPKATDRHIAAVESDTIQPAIVFEKDVLPILQAKCSPCHFEGGKMYAKMPFDNPKTIKDHPEGVLKRFQEPQLATIKAYLSK